MALARLAKEDVGVSLTNATATTYRETSYCQWEESLVEGWSAKVDFDAKSEIGPTGRDT